VTKTIIKHRETGRYLTTKGWSANPAEALPFKTSLQALDFCCKKKMHEAVLVLKFSDPRFDIELHPFDSDSPKPGRRVSSSAE
jgi:hypothetical protein